MIYDPTPNSSGWAQSGILYYPYIGCIRTFSQWVWNESNGQGTVPGDNRWVTKTGPCASIGTTHHVWEQAVQLNNGSWTIRMNIDSTTYDSMNVDPFNVWHAPFYTTFEDETAYYGTDQLGYSGTKSEWNGILAQDLSTNVWTGVCNGYDVLNVTRNFDNAGHLINTPRYATDATACNHTRAWTSQP
jgi:hypothetical protein